MGGGGKRTVEDTDNGREGPAAGYGGWGGHEGGRGDVGRENAPAAPSRRCVVRKDAVGARGEWARRDSARPAKEEADAACLGGIGGEGRAPDGDRRTARVGEEDAAATAHSAADACRQARGAGQRVIQAGQRQAAQKAAERERRRRSTLPSASDFSSCPLQPRTHLLPRAETESKTVELTPLRATAPPPVPRATLSRNWVPPVAAKDRAFSTCRAPPPPKVTEAPEASFEENTEPEMATEAEEAKTPPPDVALLSVT